MKAITSLLVIVFVICHCCFGGSATNASLVRLPLKFPMPALAQGPDIIPSGPHIEPFPTQPPAAFLAPEGVTNLALRKKATASVKEPIAGAFSQITDGEKEALDGQVVEMRKGLQWVQIDLEHDCLIYAVVIWRDFRFPLTAFRAVVVQVADDPEFTSNVRTLFNNDADNRAGLGLGADKMYVETHYGRVIDAKGVKARYVRCYSNGSTRDILNSCIEVEVWGFGGK